MHLDSDLDAVSASYSNFTVAVLYDTVPGGGTGTPGSIACVLNTGSPDYSSIALDAIGTWTFDFEVTTTAGSVAADVPETVTIIGPRVTVPRSTSTGFGAKESTTRMTTAAIGPSHLSDRASLRIGEVFFPFVIRES